MHPTFAEKPRVRIGVVSVYMGLKKELYLIGHTWSPYFSEGTGKAICVLVFPILQTEFKTFNQIVLRKERRAKILTNTFDSGTISGNREGKILQRFKQW